MRLCVATVAISREKLTRGETSKTAGTVQPPFLANELPFLRKEQNYSPTLAPKNNCAILCSTQRAIRHQSLSNPNRTPRHECSIDRARFVDSIAPPGNRTTASYGSPLTTPAPFSPS